MTITVEEWRSRVAKNIQDHQQKLARLSNQLGTLERKLRPLFDFWMERQISILLRNDGNPRTWRWILNRLGHDAWQPLQHLCRKGLVTTEKSGHNILYKLVDEVDQ